MSIEIKTVKINEMHMRYFSFGNPDKEAVIILPGLSVKSVMESAEAIAAAYQKLSSDFCLYVLDRRSDVKEGYTVYDMAEDSYQALREIGLKEANLFGVSQGGMIAQVMAIRHPEFVKAMALCSTTSRVGNSEALKKWVKYAEDNDAKSLMEGFADDVYSPAFLAKYRDAIVSMADAVTEEEMKRFVIMAKATDGFDVYDELEKIKCPVIVVGAANDKVLGAQASVDLAEKLNGELFIYEGYGHAVYDEAPDYLDRIYDFYMRSR